MFSELALGNFGPDGVLNINRNISLYDNVRTKCPTASCKLTSAASCPAFTRQRSTVTIGSYAQSETKLNELTLPKTYITRKGDMLLFAVIDNELFALVDSANKSATKPKERNNGFAIKPEMLSQYRSLEDFVLAVLEYKHKKEKYLYASATKKLSHFIKKRKYTGRTGRNAFLENQRINREPEAHVHNFLTSAELNHVTENDDLYSEVSASRSVQLSVKHDNGRDESSHRIQVENEPDFDRLVLPAENSAKISGRLRSPLLERKANTHRSTIENGDKEYLNFSVKMDQQAMQGLPIRSIINTNRKLLEKFSVEQRKEFLFSVNGFFQENNSKRSTDSVKGTSLLQENLKKVSGYFKHVTDNGLSFKVVTNGNSQAQGKTTILPFVFDGRPAMKNGRPVLKGLRQSSAIQSFPIRKSVSNQDLRNLRGGICSARTMPEKRALGVTPSAISLNSENFSRMLEYNSSNRFTLNLADIDNRMYSTSVLQTFQEHNAASLRGLDDLENWKASADLLQEKYDPQNMDEYDFTQMSGIESDGNDVPGRHGSRRESKSPSILRGIEDDDDNILFSYISPGLRRGSWNPTLSVSFDSFSRENSKTEEFSRENTFSKGVSNRWAEPYAEEAQMEYGRSTASQGSNGSHTALDNAVGFIDESKQGQRNVTPLLVTDNDQCDPSSFLFPGEGENLYGMRRRRSLSLTSDRNSEKATRRSRNISEGSKLSSERSYEQGLIDGAKHVVKVSDKVEGQEVGRRYSPLSLKADELSDTTVAHNEETYNRTGNLQRETHSCDGESGFSTNTGANISIRDSVADEANLANKVQLAAKEFSDEKSHTTDNEGMQREQSAVSIRSGCNNDKSIFENSGEARLLNDTISNDDVKQPANSSVEVKERLQENVVTSGLLNQQISKAHNNPIIEDFTKYQQTLYLEEGVFAAKQLLDIEIEAHSTQVMKKSIDRVHSNEVARQQFKPVIDDEPNVSPIVQDTAQTTENMSSFLKPGREAGKDRNTKQAGKRPADKPEKQTMELKIDLKVAEDSSPDNASSDARKSHQSMQSSAKDALNADKNPLRLDGLGGSEAKDQTTLEELKSLLQSNMTTDDSVKAKKKQSDKTPIKRAVLKQRRKKNIPSRQSSISKKAADSKNLSPVLDLPKKMVTVETMIGRPKQSENLMKPSPDTEPEAAIEREVTFENQLEMKESGRNVAVQNVEVEKVSEMDPEKIGAYPPSKPKRGTKKGGKKTNNGNKEQAQEKLKYEEQMRLLKEKEIEQQRAREAALAKQKVLEQEKEKYKEDEEEAKKNEEEARKRLAEAKQKAKEEREAKRLADAEKRRQLVEQRREERRQKDLELAEKEKEANRLRFEREARAQELKEQRQRLEEQEKLEEEQMLKNEKLEELKREEEEKRLEEERIKKAQEELERLVEEREYRQQLRRVAEAQELKMREAEEHRRLQEEREQQKIAEERERIKRIEYLKLQAELERQKEAENLADERRQIMLLKAAKRKAELIKCREENLERMSSLKSTRHSQSISRSFTFTYFVHIPRSVWEMPIGWNSKTGKGSRGGKTRPFSVTTMTRGSK